MAKITTIHCDICTKELEEHEVVDGKAFTFEHLCSNCNLIAGRIWTAASRRINEDNEFIKGSVYITSLLASLDINKATNLFGTKGLEIFQNFIAELKEFKSKDGSA